MSKDASTNKKRSGLRLLALPLFLLALWQYAFSVLILLGMFPSLIAWALDRDRAKLTAVNVAALNAAALTPLALKLWHDGPSISGALALLTTPISWALILIGVTAGWVLAQVVPMVIAGIIVARERAHVQKMRERQKQLVEEWGAALTEGIESPPPRH